MDCNQVILDLDLDVYNAVKKISEPSINSESSILYISKNDDDKFTRLAYGNGIDMTNMLVNAFKEDENLQLIGLVSLVMSKCYVSGKSVNDTIEKVRDILNGN